MYLPATLLLTLMGCLVLVTATPIPKTQSLEAAIHARQVENLSNYDDSPALYEIGTPVEGTSAYRDSTGIYHNYRRREEQNLQVKRQADDSAFSGSSVTTRADGTLWARAQMALLALLKRETPKLGTEEAQGSFKITEREVGAQVSADKAPPLGVLNKLNKGERIYF